MMTTGSPAFKSGHGQANGLRFHWIEKGAGPLVLALHGFPDLPRTFRYQMHALARAGYRIVAPYMRGYFPTEAPADASYHRAALTQDALALTDVLSDDPIILLGHDWGAAAAYGAAILAPDKIARLITIAVPYGETWWNALLENPIQQRRSWYIYFFQLSFAESALAHNDFALLERLWRDWSPGWAYPPEELQAVRDTFRQPGVLPAALNYYRHIFDPPAGQPALQAIDRRYGEPISAPSLYIHGADDGGIGAENAAGMEEWFPGGLQKQIIAGAGHFVHQEQPDQVNQLILDFLQA